LHALGGKKGDSKEEGSEDFEENWRSEKRKRGYGREAVAGT